MSLIRPDGMGWDRPAIPRRQRRPSAVGSTPRALMVTLPIGDRPAIPRRQRRPSAVWDTSSAVKVTLPTGDWRTPGMRIPRTLRLLECGACSREASFCGFSGRACGDKVATLAVRGPLGVVGVALDESTFVVAGDLTSGLALQLRSNSGCVVVVCWCWPPALVFLVQRSRLVVVLHARR